MDLSNNNIGKAKDRISELPDSVLHHVLSFLETKCVARTCVLSKRWNHIWTSIPILKFTFWQRSEPPSSIEINKFMDFQDRTLFLHDSNIRKFNLHTNEHFNASRIYPWIENLVRRNVEDLELLLGQGKPFYIPLSLFTCESLIKLELSANDAHTALHLPKNFCFPKLTTLSLYGIDFTDDNCWNEQQFSNCPVLEDLILEHCTWIGVRNFCISTPTLKLLNIHANDYYDDDGLGNCALKINAPNLVSFSYSGRVAKEYVLSSFPTLKSAEVLLDVPRDSQIGYGEAISNFIRALSHVQNLELHPVTLKTLSSIDDFVLPTFHDLQELILWDGKTTDKSLFSLLKAVPNLRCLVFEEDYIDNNEDQEEQDSWAAHMLTAGCLFQHLRSVCFFCFRARWMRWLKLILKNARALQSISIGIPSHMDAESKEVLMAELLSLPKASDGCMFEFP